MSVSKWMPTIVGTCVLILGAAAQASAASIIFTFDCDIAGPACSPGAPIGTLTISDSLANTNWVDISLVVTTGDPQKFYFNYPDAGVPRTAGYTFKADGTDVQEDQNNKQADGYSIGQFDLAIPDGGGISGSPYTTVLKLSDATNTAFDNLDAIMFANLSTDGALFAAVNRTTGNSWFGATSCVGCGTVTVAAIPEPASLLLLGTGLAASAARLRRRNRSVGR